MPSRLDLFAQPAGPDADLDRTLTDARRALLALVKAEIEGATVDRTEMDQLRRQVLDLSSGCQSRHPPAGGGFVIGKRRRGRRMATARTCPERPAPEGSTRAPSDSNGRGGVKVPPERSSDSGAFLQRCG